MTDRAADVSDYSSSAPFAVGQPTDAAASACNDVSQPSQVVFDIEQTTAVAESGSPTIGAVYQRQHRTTVVSAVSQKGKSRLQAIAARAGSDSTLATADKLNDSR